MRIISVFCLLSVTFIAGCVPVKKKTPPPPKVEVATEEFLKKTEPALSRESSALPQIPATQTLERETSESLFSISVEGANVRDVLRAFARDSKLSIVIDPDVQGIVNLDLKQVTLKQLLFFLLDPLELEHTREGDVIRVSTRKLRTRIFNVNHLLIERAASGSIAVSQFSENIETGTTQITSENASSFWNEIEEQLKLLIFDDAASSGGSKGGGTPDGGSAPAADATDSAGGNSEGAVTAVADRPKLIIHRGSGLILVKAPPDVLEVVAKYLELIEGSVQRQVQIVSRIVEVALDDSHQLGIDWSLQDTTNFSGDVGLQQQGVFAAPDVIPSVTPARGFFTASFDSNKTSFVIDALKKQGDVKVLSSPRISTLNNQPALIKVAREEVFFSTSETREVEGNRVTTTFSTEQQKITVGIVLRVTPQIGNDQSVMMDVHPIVTELVRTSSVVTPEGQVLATAPIIDVREVNVVVHVNNEQTVAIGGLMRHREVEIETGIPLLSSIPILGELFKRHESRSEKNELVVFLTPIVDVGRRLEELSAEEIQALRKKDKDMFDKLIHQAPKN